MTRPSPLTSILAIIGALASAALPLQLAMAVPPAQERAA